MLASLIDINETSLRKENPEVLAALLRCHSSWRNAGCPESREADFNIIWATNDYEYLGEGYGFSDHITPDLITGTERGEIIQPRVLKDKETQARRIKEKAEVFTPSWVCNVQNNLVDEAWFGRKDVFNTTDDLKHWWEPTYDKIVFPDGKTWEDYVKSTRLEMCCGEAPYLTSRYDTVSGDWIPVERRIGLLDRKLRIISENVDKPKDWITWAANALKSTYGFEWQGDSLLLAREALLYTVYDFFKEKFGKDFPEKERLYLAYIISWNIFQMDGLKLVVPGSCKSLEKGVNLFTGEKEYYHCPGCKDGTRTGHNGIPALLAEWRYSSKTKPRVAKPFLHSLITK